MTDKPEPLDLSIFDGHTPGPWRFIDTGVCGAYSQIYGGDNACVAAAEFEYDDMDGEAMPVMRVSMRDALLILAAPDLLAEVKRLRAEVEAWRGYALQIGAALRASTAPKSVLVVGVENTE